MVELVLATCLARLASRMFALVIVLYVLQRFDSPVLAGWVVFAAMAPGLVISPLAGALLDRMGAAKAIVIDMAASAALLLALAVADMAGAVTAPLLIAFAAIFSLTAPLAAAAYFLVPAVSDG